MPDPSLAVPIGNAVAGVAWLLLLASLFAPPIRPAGRAAARFAVPALFAVAYILLIVRGFGEAEGGGFSTAAEVRALFASDSALAAGWLHYLAFDLFVGAWIAEAGPRHGIHPLLLVPCLALTFLFGPAGLLLFLLLRLPLRQPRKEIPA